MLLAAASGCAALDAFTCELSPKEGEKRACHEDNRRRREARVQRLSVEAPACERGELAACERAGHLAELEQEFDVAASSFGLACDGGIASACRRLGHLHAEARIPGTQRTQGLRFFERACALGDADGCATAVPIARSASASAAFAERACTLGGRRCAVAGATVAATDPARAAGLYRRGCRAGDQDACAALGRVAVEQP